MANGEARLASPFGFRGARGFAQEAIHPVMRILVLAARDLWAESFLLMAFNLVWALTSLPGLALIGTGAISRDLILIGLGLVAMALWPLSTFGLFHAAAQAAHRRAVHFRTLLDGARAAPALAYRWGAIALAGTGLLAANAAFYLDPLAPAAGTGLAGFLASVFLFLLALWLMAQVFLAAWIATGQADTLRAAWRRLSTQFVRHPVQSLLTGAVMLLLSALGIAVIPAGLLLAFACVASLACRAVLTWAGIAAPPPVEGP